MVSDETKQRHEQERKAQEDEQTPAKRELEDKQMQERRAEEDREREQKREAEDPNS